MKQARTFGVGVVVATQNPWTWITERRWRVCAHLTAADDEKIPASERYTSRVAAADGINAVKSQRYPVVWSTRFR